MKLSLVFSVLTSIVVLATAYPTQGATGIAKRSNTRKRGEELDFNPVDYIKRGEGKREELDANILLYPFDYTKRDEGKREELDANILLYPFDYTKRDEGKREELDTDILAYPLGYTKRDEGKREELDVDCFDCTFPAAST
ncbi:hypothetical protein BD769DRAFT_1661769 [Suillus cothurnatus]|nr:hypothetical protein BD769DRAFT_1661769 [Suillus cothurnatus]